MWSVREERAFWAHQLHAKVLNSIGAVIVQSQVCERAVQGGLPNSAEEVTRLKEMLADLEETTRSLLAVPFESSGRPLGDEIEKWISRLQSRHPGASIRYHIRGIERKVPGRVALGISGILVESISNALRHGQPSTVDVDLSFLGEALLLRIRDDGHGFDISTLLENNSSSTGRQFGVTNMRQLAEIIGANFALSSAPGRGTQVTLYTSWTKRRGRPGRRLARKEIG